MHEPSIFQAEQTESTSPDVAHDNRRLTGAVFTLICVAPAIPAIFSENDIGAMKSKTILILVSTVIFVLQACASPNYGGSSDLATPVASDLPVPSATDATSAPRTFVVGPYDKLRIDVFGVEEMTNLEVQADAAGQISFPLVGTVEAAGRTPAQIAAAIAGALESKYVRDPQVTVNLVENLSQVVTVDGAVEEPGIYPVMGSMTLLRAVATAGGTSDYAREGAVVVFRTVGENRYAGLYNLEGIRRGNYPDPAIFPNDIVVVDESAALRRFDRFLQITPLITSPLVLLLR